jgi:hypothetical protein
MANPLPQAAPSAPSPPPAHPFNLPPPLTQVLEVADPATTTMHGDYVRHPSSFPETQMGPGPVTLSESRQEAAGAPGRAARPPACPPARPRARARARPATRAGPRFSSPKPPPLLAPPPLPVGDAFHPLKVAGVGANLAFEVRAAVAGSVGHALAAYRNRLSCPARVPAATLLAPI